MKPKTLACFLAVCLLAGAAWTFRDSPYRKFSTAAHIQLTLLRTIALERAEAAKPTARELYSIAAARFRRPDVLNDAVTPKAASIASIGPVTMSCQKPDPRQATGDGVVVLPAILEGRSGCPAKPSTPRLAARPLSPVVPIRAATKPTLAAVTASAVVAAPSSGSAPVPAPVRLPAPAVVQPLGPDGCNGTSLNIVAHQDDDLLFMNPDVFGDIKAGRCIRTVYLTAGDAGVEQAYWQHRELGSEAAYAQMFGQPDRWTTQRRLLDGVFVTEASLDGIPNVSLLFLRLPDGNLRGSGFAATHRESLQLLLAGVIPVIHTVDTQTAIGSPQLVSMVQSLLVSDKPAIIRTLGSDNLEDGDHSDHHAAGQLTKLATTGNKQGVSVQYYLGYPDRLQPVNLSSADILVKQEAFLTYAQYDGAVCQTVTDCQQMYTYGRYLERQYVISSGTTPPPPVADGSTTTRTTLP